MKKARSSVQPESLIITPTTVYVTSNVAPYREEMDDGHILEGYEYDYEEYSKDNYIFLQLDRIASLEEQLAAAKILLGVDE